MNDKNFVELMLNNLDYIVFAIVIYTCFMGIEIWITRDFSILKQYNFLFFLLDIFKISKGIFLFLPWLLPNQQFIPSKFQKFLVLFIVLEYVENSWLTEYFNYYITFISPIFSLIIQRCLLVLMATYILVPWLWQNVNCKSLPNKILALLCIIIFVILDLKIVKFIFKINTA